MLKTLAITWFLAAGISLQVSVQAQELAGTEQVIEEIRASINQPEAEGEPTPVDPFEAALAEWKSARQSLEPEAAAEKWLELVKLAFPTRKPFERNYFPDEESRFVQVLQQLPQPDHWPSLAEEIEQIPEGTGSAEKIRRTALHLLTYTLTGDAAAQKGALDALQPLLAERAGREQDHMAGFLIAQVLEHRMILAETPEERYTAWKQQLEFAKGNPLGARDMSRLPSGLTEEQMREVIKEMLLLDGEASSRVLFTESIRPLARQVALENLDSLKQPPWGLSSSTSPDAMRLFEALEKKFGEEKKAEEEEEPQSSLEGIPRFQWNMGFPGRSPRKDATAYYIAGLVLAGRTDEALARAQKPESYTMTSLKSILLSSESSIGASRFYNFVKELLAAAPDLDLWGAHIHLAAKTGKARETLELLEKRLAEQEISTKERESLRSQLAQALLSAGEVERGVEELRKAIEAESDAEIGYRSAADTLLLLGRVRENEQWISEALQLLDAKLANPDTFNSGMPLLVELYTQPEYQARGQKAITQALATRIKEANASKEEASRQYWAMGAEGGAVLLPMLANIYHAAGRSADVLKLLRQAPWWGASDLAEINEDSFDFGTSFHEVKPRGVLPVQYLAAASLINEGETDQGLRILKALLYEQGGFDPAYELFLRTDPEQAVSFFRELFELDRFQERPLIWIAQHLSNTRQFEEAEKLARQAVEIDPSDGEQGPGDRMRVYAVLAEIRAARGDAEQAEFFRQAVRAIRLAEEADRIYAAGLLSEGIEKYQEALTFFADAYCIQSRLAVQLSEMGLHELAEQHYIKAFELMPDSFGRMESHCFGCEGVFESEQAQNVAERVFTRLVQASPDKPQLHYLRAYLKESQKQTQEALAGYRKAVELDPDYINAWKKLSQLSHTIFLPAEERDAIAMNLLRLDPLRRHSGIPTGVRNIREIWPLLVRADELRPERPDSLLKLTASAEKMNEEESAEVRGQRLRMLQMDRAESAVKEFVSGHESFQFAGQLLEAASNMQ